MSGKTERVEARIEPERAERIRYASELLHTSMSRFMVDASAEKAELVIAGAAYTEVPDDYFDRLLAALEEPPQRAPALARAAARATSKPAFKQS